MGCSWPCMANPDILSVFGTNDPFAAIKSSEFWFPWILVQWIPWWHLHLRLSWGGCLVYRLALRGVALSYQWLCIDGATIAKLLFMISWVRLSLCSLREDFKGKHVSLYEVGTHAPELLCCRANKPVVRRTGKKKIELTLEERVMRDWRPKVYVPNKYILVASTVVTLGLAYYSAVYAR